jgi:hypothetical protein
MARIQTPINGISTTSAYQEGDCYSLVNLRPKNGALHPVSPRKELQELSQKYDIVFIHQNNNYKNWIGVVNSNSYSSVYFWDDSDKQPKSIASSITGKVNSIQQIGNTLSLITAKGIKYIYYDSEKYVLLGEIPDMKPIKHIAVENDAVKFFLHGDTQDTLRNSILGAFNFIWDDLEPKGTIPKQSGGDIDFIDAHLVVFAFRLYDGTLV